MYELQELLAVRPVIGRRVRYNGAARSEWLLPVEQLAVGDVVSVLPGERIPADGVVVKGVSMVSKQPVNRIAAEFNKKIVGDKVVCGTINGADALEIKVTHTWKHGSFEQRLEQARAEHDRLSCWERFWQHITEQYKTSYN